MPDGLAAFWTFATFLNFPRQHALPNIQTRLALSGSYIGFAAFSTVSTPFVSFVVVAIRPGVPYALWHLPTHSSSPNR